MPKISRKWVKRLLIGSALAVLLPLAAIGALAVIVDVVFSPQALPAGFLGPNCPGISITVSGEVRDVNNQPIPSLEIKMLQVSWATENDQTLNFVTNDEGRFQTQNSIHVYYCDNLIFEAPARDFAMYEGNYEGIQILYAVADNYGEDDFPPQPIPIRLIITLVEKLAVTDEADEAD